MLLAVLRLPWAWFPACFVGGLLFGMSLNFDPRFCPNPAHPVRQTSVSDYQLQARLSLIRVCQGIDQRNPAMLTPQCIALLHPHDLP
jgi:hypothetical protein